MPSHHYVFAVLSWESVLSPALHWEYTIIGQIPATSVPSLAEAHDSNSVTDVKCK